MTNLFPHEGFDEWAVAYDTSVSNEQFPFNGYQRVLRQVVALAEARPGMSVLDLGTGTGNLAAGFARLSCELTQLRVASGWMRRSPRRMPARKTTSAGDSAWVSMLVAQSESAQSDL